MVYPGDGERQQQAWFRKTEPIQESIPAKESEGGEVLHAVLTLPLKYRTVIHLFYYEGMTVEEIGRALGEGASTVKSQLLRARKRLREMLKEDNGNA